MYIFFLSQEIHSLNKSQDIWNACFGSVILSVFIAIICATYALMLLSLLFRSKPSFTKFILRFLYLVLGCYVAILFAAQVMFTQIFCTRSAQIHAFADGVELPNSAVQTAVEPFGVDNAYRHIGYCKLLCFFTTRLIGLVRLPSAVHPAVVVPWLTFFFALIAVIIGFLAVRAPATAEAPAGVLEQDRPETVQVVHDDEKTLV